MSSPSLPTPPLRKHKISWSDGRHNIPNFSSPYRPASESECSDFQSRVCQCIEETNNIRLESARVDNDQGVGGTIQLPWGFNLIVKQSCEGEGILKERLYGHVG